MDQQGDHSFRPSIYCGDLAKLPAALQPLCARPQWVIWRLTWRHGRWTKPPFRCDDPHRFASSNDPSSWSSYEIAIAAAAEGDGISYVLTPEDPFAAIDIDHVRDPITGTIENWAQRFLDKRQPQLRRDQPLRHRFTDLGHGQRRDPAPEIQLRRYRRSSYSGAPASRSPSPGSSSATARHSATSTPCSIAPSYGRSSASRSSARASRRSPPVPPRNTRSMRSNGSCGKGHRKVPTAATPSTALSATISAAAGPSSRLSRTLSEFPDGIGNRYIAEGRLAARSGAQRCRIRCR